MYPVHSAHWTVFLMQYNQWVKLQKLQVNTAMVKLFQCVTLVFKSDNLKECQSKWWETWKWIPYSTYSGVTQLHQWQPRSRWSLQKRDQKLTVFHLLHTNSMNKLRWEYTPLMCSIWFNKWIPFYFLALMPSLKDDFGSRTSLKTFVNVTLTLIILILYVAYSRIGLICARSNYHKSCLGSGLRARQWSTQCHNLFLSSDCLIQFYACNKSTFILQNL